MACTLSTSFSVFIFTSLSIKRDYKRCRIN
nr:MAG TPA: hypothetical protein [Caudoviricetes sp.]